MSDDDIDLERVVSDPLYRRQVIEFLNSVEPEPQDARREFRSRQVETVN